MNLQIVLIAGVSVGIAFAVVALARRGLLTFRYTMGWLALLTLSALSALFVRLSEPLSRALNVTPGVVATFTGAVILVLICLQLSVSISRLQKQIRRMAEQVTLSAVQHARKSDSRHILVIVPAFNEEMTVGNVTRELVEHGYQVLVVDDGSKDRTADEASSTGACVIRMPFNTGVGGALRAGFRFAVLHGYSIVVQCDADGQHPVPYVSKLLERLESRNCHMVIGSRFANGRSEAMQVPKHRRMAMWVLGRYATRAVGSTITDVTSGFRAFRGDLVVALSENMPAYYLGDTYETVISAGRAGYRIEEIHVPIGERVNGNSSAHPVQAAWMTAKAFLTSALHLHVRLNKPLSSEGQ